jgi:hypothetical protein
MRAAKRPASPRPDRRPGRLWLSAVALAVAGIVSSACSTPYIYAGSAQLKMVFRVPGSWTAYSSREMGDALAAVLDSSFAGQYPFLAGFDGAPDPSLQDVINPGRLLNYPVVISWVRTLPPGARDQLSLRALRNALYPVDQIESDGSGQTISYSSFSLPGGYWGNKITFVIRGTTPTTAGSALELAQIAATDAGAKYQYVLIVSCTPDCFARNKGAIDDVLNSWRLKG